VAASRIAVQVTHELGKSSGGTFNLESDLHHLEIHVDYEPGFTPSESTLKAKVSATAGMIQAQIPVVATVQVEETSARYVRVIAVDQTGNKSGPSDAASATALLIDDAHISDLTVSKVTAGSILADWVVAARLKTADTGARAEMSASGFETYNSSGTRTLFADAATGDVSLIGQLSSGTSGRRLVVNPTGVTTPEIRLYPTSGSNYALISSFDNTSTPASAAGLLMRTTPDANDVYSLVAMDEQTATFGRWEFEASEDLFFAKGGYSKAESAQIRTAWFSGYGGNFGGSFLASETRAEAGWFGAASASWNYMHFDNDGITRHYGIFAPQCLTAGFATVTPVANTPTSVTLTGFGPLTGNNFYGFVTAQTTVIGSTVQGVAHTNVTASSITVWVYRTNTTNTNLDWMIIGRP
jgi:hypothetical protein